MKKRKTRRGPGPGRKPKSKSGRGARKDADKTTKRKEVLGFEITGILLLFLALFILISLLSYYADDPSWANVTAAGQKARNFGGRAGAHLSEAFLQFLGIASYLFALALGYVAVKTILRASSGRLLQRLGSVFLLIVILCPFFALLFQTIPISGNEIPAGGITGKFFLSILERYLNTIGSLIFLVAALALYFLYSTQWSVAKTFHFFKGTLDSTVKEVRIRIVNRRKAKEREKMREKVIKKYAAPPPATPPPAAEEKAEEVPEKTTKKERRKKREEKKPGKQPAGAPKPAAPAAPQKVLFPDFGKKGEYHFPPFNLLDLGKPAEKIDKNELFDKKNRIEEKLKEFGVDGEVKEYHPGPVITTYEFFPAPGIKVSKVANLSEELSLALEAESVRIQRIPGKSSLGVEIPNDRRETISFRDIAQSEKFIDSPSKLTFALGKSVHGEPYFTDLAVMPHLLIAGATGSGKSVCLNALIASILYKATPEEVKLILIDPKRLEFTPYEGVPHLLAPVVNDPKKSSVILMDAVRKMEERYKKLSSLKVRNIDQYNQQMKQTLAEKKGNLTEEEKEACQPLPYLVIIIDELAELMMVSAQEVEYCIGRLAQLARAVGIHLIMATQRPSIDVITGTIKNNFSCRIAFRVPSKVDSRIIIDGNGAEKLLGLGDMLFLPPNFPRVIRIHGAFISIPEVKRLVQFVKKQGTPTYDDRLVNVIKGGDDDFWDDSGEKDERYGEALRLVLQTGQASASYLQRRLKLGYARAARLIDQMEHEGIIGPSEGSKAREILVDRRAYLKEIENNLDRADD
jgi:S-DNA-T family DNA segregation ATPase FtsK/SpoIIIE